MCSSLRGRFDTLITDIISSLQISQHHHRHYSITLDVAISTQTLQHIIDFAPHRRHRSIIIDFAPST
jgi:Tfp pilus assembly ATPase PilU